VETEIRLMGSLMDSVQVTLRWAFTPLKLTPIVGVAEVVQAFAVPTIVTPVISPVTVQ
jgi:hypothetical protein